MKDMKLLRERYFDIWINNWIRFNCVDGYAYAGILEDWYEDGTLVLYDLKVTSERLVKKIPPNADKRYYTKDPDSDFYYEFKNVNAYGGLWAFFKSDWILFFITDRLGGADSDKMTDAHRAKRLNRIQIDNARKAKEIGLTDDKFQKTTLNAAE